MKTKKLIIALASVVLITGFASCGGDNTPKPEGSLSICAYNGGYGIDWLKDICLEFENQTGIICTAYTDATLLQSIETQLTNKRSDYDIFISHDLNWQNYASRGLLTDLDDLYSREVDNGKTFVERFANNAPELSKSMNDLTSEEHYYKVNFTQGAGGFVYNSSMFEEHGWAIPETYEDLVSLCATITSTTNIKPFAWAGSGEARDYYWDYVIYEWWAEMDGYDKIQEWLTFKGADGTYSTGYDNFDPDGKFANFKKAYEMWYNLVALNPSYSMDNAQSETLLRAQSNFYLGKAAMIPYGQWAKKEIEMALGENFTFDVKFMRTPKVKEESDYYNFMVGFGDSMIVPSNIPEDSQENAKKFLAFMSSDYACKKFVEKADGPFLAFDYSDIDMTDLEANNTYIKSMHEILNDSVNFSTATNSPLVVLNSNTTIQPWINNSRYYTEAMTNPTNNTPDLVLDRVYESARSSWPRFCSNAGVQ